MFTPPPGRSPYSGRLVELELRGCKIIFLFYWNLKVAKLMSNMKNSSFYWDTDRERNTVFIKVSHQLILKIIYIVYNP